MTATQKQDIHRFLLHIIKACIRSCGGPGNICEKLRRDHPDVYAVTDCKQKQEAQDFPYKFYISFHQLKSSVNKSL